MKKRLLKYLSPYKGSFAVALLCMVIFGASDGGVPFLVRHVLDKVFTSQNEKFLYLTIVIVVGFAVVRAITDFCQQYFMSKVGHFIVRDIRDDMNRHFLSLSPGFFIKQSTANLISRSTSDVLLVRGLLTDSIASVIRDSIRVVTLLISALYLDPGLALISLVVLPVGFYPIYKIGRRMRRLSRKGQEGIGLLSSALQESVMGNRVVKIFVREKLEIEKFRDLNEKLTKTFIRSEIARALTGPINEVLAALAVCGVIFYGGFSVMEGSRTQGAFIGFLVAVFLLYDPIKKLSRLHVTVQQGLAGAERIFEIFDTKPDIVGPENPVRLTPDNSISIENVTFSYNPGDPSVLTDLSLAIPEGKKIAIVGFSGAGKSTLVDLIPRFIDPQKGVVRIGGVDVRKVALKELRSRIAMVSQHTFLFHDTIFNNIVYGCEGATREEVEKAAKLAFAHDFIVQLPKGYDSVVGESGFSISGGERQRIAIARAILKNAPILILDEATASLDNRSEREVQSALHTLTTGRTSIVIAHRLSTIHGADQIVVLREGQVVEIGHHDELISIQGEYARLYALQFRAGEGSEDIVLQ